jgi:transposase
MDLTDRQWTIIEPLFEEKRRPDGRGRPWRDARAVLNGVLWALRNGAPWHDLPDRYPPYQTCHRRFQQWRKNGVFRDLLTWLTEDLRLRGKIDLTESFIDTSFTAAKKGLCHRSYKAQQRRQDHGNRRPPQSSSYRARGLCFTT